MSDFEKGFFDKLEEEGVNVTPEQRANINAQLSKIVNYVPRIGVFGKTGVGKSSLCNALFGQKICEISDVEACTRNAKEVILNMDGNGIKLIDVPGVGESTTRDEEYGKLYSELLPNLDLVLWLIKSDDRALASDETFYNNIVKPHIDDGKPFFFVLNQVDKIEPYKDWNEEKHEPGARQFQNIHKKIDYIAEKFDIASSRVIPVSANEKYNLTKLVDEFVRALPAEKKITVFRAVNEEFQSIGTVVHVKKSFLDVLENVVCKGLDVVGSVGCAIINTIGKAAESMEDFFDDINPFKRNSGGGGCYITTAVCQNNSKPDDCYELQTFRKFRDEWLANQEVGKYLIQEYYRVAPEIVRIIDSKENSSEIYNSINTEYLIPCLHYIEMGDMQSCKECYTNMVNVLFRRYIE